MVALVGRDAMKPVADGASERLRRVCANLGGSARA
jgi:hypothetical protein